MNNTCIVRRVQAKGDLVDDVEKEFKGGPRIGLQERGERFAIEELHDEIGEMGAFYGGESEIGDVDDVGMTKAAGGFGLTLKPQQELVLRSELGNDHF